VPQPDVFEKSEKADEQSCVVADESVDVEVVEEVIDEDQDAGADSHWFTDDRIDPNFQKFLKGF